MSRCGRLVKLRGGWLMVMRFKVDSPLETFRARVCKLELAPG